MRKLFTILSAVLLTASVFLPQQASAQAPEKMSYQAVVRDGSNNLVSFANVGMQVSILQGSVSGTAVYVETQTPTSNANGLVSIEIGAGTVVSGTFASIDWSAGPYFIKTETDPTGGTNYTITGTSELLSVPYALYAASGNPGPQGPTGATGPEGPAGTYTAGNGITISGGSIAAAFSGSGTTNYVPKFTASNALGNSTIFNGANGNIGVGTQNPLQLFHVAGTGIIMGLLGAGTATPVNRLSVNGSANITDNLGVGIVSPNYPLHTTTGYFATRIGVGTIPNNTYALDVGGSTRLNGNTRVFGWQVVEDYIRVRGDKGIVRSHTIGQYKMVPFGFTFSVALNPGQKIETGNISYGETFGSSANVRVLGGQWVSGTGTAGDAAWILITPINVGTSSCRFWIANVGPSAINFSNMLYRFQAIGPE